MTGRADAPVADFGRIPPGMAKVDVWPMSAAETLLLASLAYLALLIGLATSRHPSPSVPGHPVLAGTLEFARPVADLREAVRSVVGCVTAGTVPESYATAPQARPHLAFGPPVEPSRPLSVAEINGELWHRLCGGLGQVRGAEHGPDRRLFLALDSVVNGRDPNRAISRAEWAAGVDRFIAQAALWEQARVVTRTAPAGTVTLGMRVRPGADPLVVRTRLARATTSRFLMLPVLSDRGPPVTLTMRLPCGFQPTFLAG
jgi:hypothetical protein